MFIREKKGLLNINYVAIFNTKFASILPIYNLNKNLIIVQQNAT